MREQDKGAEDADENVGSRGSWRGDSRGGARPGGRRVRALRLEFIDVELDPGMQPVGCAR